jgi:hypothetical protein
VSGAENPLMKDQANYSKSTIGEMCQFYLIFSNRARGNITNTRWVINFLSIGKCQAGKDHADSHNYIILLF